MPDIALNDALLYGIGCVLLCGVGIVLMIALQFITGTLDVLLQFVDLFWQIVSGGPVAWCGCAVVLFGCFMCAGLSLYIVLNVLPTCGTINQVQFCTLFGY